MNEWCRAASPSVNMIVADARGLYAQVFNDFGPKFTVVDTTGEAPITAMIASITSETSAVVTTLDEARHDLEDGDVVTFAEVHGMKEINGKEFAVKVDSMTRWSCGCCRRNSFRTATFTTTTRGTSSSHQRRG